MNEKLQRKIKNLEGLTRLPAKEFFDFLQLREEDELLDLGAGTGYVSLPIAPYVKKVAALDFDADVLGYLEQKAGEQGITNIETVVGDFKDIPLANGRFDKAVASISLHEVKPLSVVLSEIHRVLKDDGLFLCIDLEETAKPSGPRVASDEMEEAIRRAGFTIKETVQELTRIKDEPVYLIVAQKNQ
ncbi:class I SAM-dependent methyltransferase [Planomicrobium sp. YIM 101495]|uniref:class I SAM-dependent methyltransferase n=1 Tax=Planomicrobium sp. YIM 101495 TaxID=2665160 RepID=UPI0012B866BB|nr:class I SAM-dependent methyltransferase [Planomicrobium sp. YIM 101495]MTD29857.1 methyltransferase domain-containing protein [Planomicrobium sp. YIM 101495]